MTKQEQRAEIDRLKAERDAYARLSKSYWRHLQALRQKLDRTIREIAP